MSGNEMIDELLEAQTTIWNIMECLKHENKQPEIYQKLSDAMNSLQSATYQIGKIARDYED